MDTTMAPNKTVMGGGMDETIATNKTVLGGGMDVTIAPSKTPVCNKTVLGGGMDVTLARDRTVLGGGMDVTIATNKTVLGGGGMDMTMAPDADDSVFADDSMLAEFKASLAAQAGAARPNTADLIASLSAHHPTADELPGSLPASADSSIDYGATATVKFSGLALANNTLVLPRKESEEDEDDGMTKCPVQFFSYDPSKPVMDHGQAAPQLNRSSSGDADMEMTEAVPCSGPAVGGGLSAAGGQTAETGPEKISQITPNTSHQEREARHATPLAEISKASGHETSSLSLFSPVVGAAQSESESASFGIGRPGESMDITKPGENMDITKPGEIKDITKAEDDFDVTRPELGMDITKPVEKEVPRIEVDEPESTDDSGWETIHNTLNIPQDNLPSSTPPILAGSVRRKTQGELLREKFPSPISEDPSPDRTEMVGMMPNFNQSVWDGDVTCFLPRGESTRAINFPIPALSKKKASPCQESSPLVPLTTQKSTALETGDITSFFPGGESTRAINFPIPAPSYKPLALVSGTFLPVVSQDAHQETVSKGNSPLVSQVLRKSSVLEVGDITSFFPPGESTRAVNFHIPPVSGKLSMIQEKSSIVEAAVQLQDSQHSDQNPHENPCTSPVQARNSKGLPDFQQTHFQPVIQSRSDHFGTAGQQLDCRPVDGSYEDQQVSDLSSEKEIKNQDLEQTGKTCELTILELTTPDMEQGEQLEKTSEMTNLDVTTPEMQLERDQFWTETGQEPQPECTLPAVEITGAPGDCGCHVLDGVGYQHVDCKEHDGRSPQLKRGGDEQGQAQGSESKKQRLSTEPECSVTRSDIERDLDGSYVQKDVSKSDVKALNTDEAMSCSMPHTVLNRLKNLSTVSTSLPVVEPSCWETKGMLRLDTEKPDSSKDIADQTNLTAESVVDRSDAAEDNSPLPSFPSVSFRDLSARLLVQAAGRGAEDTESSVETEEQVQETAPIVSDVQETVSQTSPNKSLGYSDEKMITAEEEPSCLLDTSSCSPPRLLSLTAREELSKLGGEDGRMLSFNYEMISKPSNNQACDYKSFNLEPISSSEILQNSNNCEANEFIINEFSSSKESNKEIVMDVDIQKSEDDADVKNKEGEPVKVSINGEDISECEKKLDKEGQKDIYIEKSIAGTQKGVVSSKPTISETEISVAVIHQEAASSNFSHEEVTIFADLVARKASSDSKDPARWRLVSHCSQSNTAVYSWMANTLVLALHLGEKLKPKKSRKSLGRAVGHWTVTKLYMTSMHRGEDSDPIDQVFDAAHFSVTRKFPESALRSQCPNTYSLSSLLKSISAYVTPAHSFFLSLNYVRNRFYPFSAAGNLVTVGFVSTALGQAFDVQVDFSEGFGSAPSTFRIVSTIGPVNEEMVNKLVSSVNPGPEYIKEMASRVEQYLGEKEKMLGGQKKKVR